MPLYEISHAAPFTKAQKDDMALAITKLQCSKFGTPSIFVTVIFTDTAGLDAYVAGKPVSTALESGYAFLYQRRRYIPYTYNSFASCPLTKLIAPTQYDPCHL
jgi:phenylpyruvate tautomerase PptA (4-oxalocrotonate tautomerase family)